MAAEERLLSDLIEAVLEGRPVDWNAAEAAISGSERALLADLRAVAGIASFHAQSSAGEDFRAAVSDLASVSPPLATPEVLSSRSTSAATVDAIPEGATWGSLRVLERVGQGAFGDVYRAWDSRLDREVALKLIRRLESLDSIASHVIDEGRLLASVRHPNVVTVYGADRIDGRVGLWMEFVRGRTLEAALRDQGPFGAEEATLIGLDLCRALSAVHGAGLIHRDVKAQNVMREAGGRIVLMDFGTGREDLSDKPADVAGTPLYVAPEVLGGAPATARSDIYSVGVLLFHLVTGAYPVKGRTAAELREAHGQRRRGWLRDARPDLSDTFVQTIECALDVDPDKRYESAGAMERALSRVMASSASPAVAGKARVKQLSLAITAAVALLAIGGAMTWLVLRRSDPPDLTRITFELETPQTASPNQLALSPDGTRVAAIVTSGAGPVIWLRAMDRVDSTVLAGTEGVGSVFWSPDGRAIGFFTRDGKLKKLDLAGGTPQEIADVGVFGDCAAWNRDGVIIFRGPSGQIFRIPASGGKAAPVTELDPARREVSHRFPQFLPDGIHFLFLAIAARDEDSGLYVGSLDSTSRRRLLATSAKALFAAPGHLLFMRDRTLMAQKFDLTLLETVGDAFRVADGVGRFGVTAGFTVSGTGSLAYRSDSWNGTTLTWFDRSGKSIGTLGERGLHGGVQLSHDGRRAAVPILDATRRTYDLWLYDIARRTRTQFTFDPADERNPVWSLDDSRIVFSSRRESPFFQLYVKESDGTGGEARLLEHASNLNAHDASVDGRRMLYMSDAGLDRTLWLFPFARDQKPQAFVWSAPPRSPGSVYFSPDGRWLAYDSRESGREEIYVVPSDGSPGKWRVSRATGAFPRWRRDGREIYYLEGNSRLMAAAVDGRGAAFQVGDVSELFPMLAPALAARGYDVAPDGQRFLVNALEADAQAPITVVVNWASGLGP